MKGRRPKLKVIDGGANPAHCPGPPMWLSLYAKREWKRSAPELHARHLLTPEAMATLENYCMSVGQVKEFEEMMTRDGRLIFDEAGKQMVHPAHKAQQAALRECRLCAAELALTPQRRGKGAGADDGGKSDGWSADLLA